uniref:Uncharacterized protein n=1 Tax=Arundo donax TaxID=35708 RepID=A0A0A9HBH0_ARUDO
MKYPSNARCFVSLASVNQAPLKSKRALKYPEGTFPWIEDF